MKIFLSHHLYLFCCFLLFTACMQRGDLPILGLDRDGRIISGAIPHSEYRLQLARTINDINNDMLFTLSQVGSHTRRWELRRVTLSLYLTMSFGIDAITSVGADAGVILDYRKY